ncbi:MAG TPA: hypothetical protein VE733_16710, partial [Streptosporangiaceae bacterium]|nr:hypothetical protein [Streptosporangiaceae bacterium]
RLQAASLRGVLLDVETAHGLVHGLQDLRPVLGEEVTLDVLGRLTTRTQHFPRGDGRPLVIELLDLISAEAV